MKRKLQLYLPLLSIAITSYASSPSELAELNDVRVSTNENTVAIEVDLSESITPAVSFARNPDRLIADFPNASPKQLLRHIPIGKNGVERVRIGLNHASPPVTRVVVDLDSMRPFSVEVSGCTVLLNILPASVKAGAPEAHVATPHQDAGAIDVLERAAADGGALPEISADALARAPQTQVALLPRPGFMVKGIAADSVYIDGGSNSGLEKGMRLIVRESVPSSSDANPSSGAVVAELRIIAVATSSAVAEVYEAKRKVKRGDWAILTPEDGQRALTEATARALSTVRVVLGTTLMPVEEEHRPQNNFASSEGSRLRGRLGLDYSGITSSGTTPGSSTQVGLSFQSDMTHILGTHWNLQGYWRGRINRHSQFQEPTIEDTLDKTYTMQMYYDNPDSAWVAGFGRLYLPWAVSLDTIDGGYFGRKLGAGVTAGVFAGSTPDLTSWDYAPNHQIGGSFVNISGGSYDAFHFSSTGGLALSYIDWKLDRPYLFFENEASYRNLISVYHSLIADSPRGISTDGIRPGAGISRSYLTVHIQPNPRLSFDIYHNYFRDVPTAATRIVGTGLVDKLLFQGVNAGVHFEPIRHVTLYTTLGRSEKTGDERRSLNQMYGLTWAEIMHTGVRADFHYSKFDSSFGRGVYRLLSLSRQMSNRTFWNVQVGTQSLTSAFTTNMQAQFAATSLDLNLGKHSFLQSGYTFVSGTGLNYRQWYSSWGLRFDHGQEGGPDPVPGPH